MFCHLHNLSISLSSVFCYLDISNCKSLVNFIVFIISASHIPVCFVTLTFSAFPKLDITYSSVICDLHNLCISQSSVFLTFIISVSHIPICFVTFIISASHSPFGFCHHHNLTISKSSVFLSHPQILYLTLTFRISASNILVYFVTVTLFASYSPA